MRRIEGNTFGRYAIPQPICGIPPIFSPPADFAVANDAHFVDNYNGIICVGSEGVKSYQWDPVTRTISEMGSVRALAGVQMDMNRAGDRLVVVRVNGITIFSYNRVNFSLVVDATITDTRITRLPTVAWSPCGEFFIVGIANTASGVPTRIIYRYNRAAITITAMVANTSTATNHDVTSVVWCADNLITASMGGGWTILLRYNPTLNTFETVFSLNHGISRFDLLAMSLDRNFFTCVFFSGGNNFIALFRKTLTSIAHINNLTIGGEWFFNPLTTTAAAATWSPSENIIFTPLMESNPARGSHIFRLDRVSVGLVHEGRLPAGVANRHVIKNLLNPRDKIIAQLLWVTGGQIRILPWE